MQAALAALLLWLALKDAAAGYARKIWVGGLCLALLFWGIQYENFLWGFQVQFFGVVLFAAAAFATVAMGPATGVAASAAVLLSGAAVYTLASGILVPPLAFLLGLWVGRPRWYFAVLLIAAIGWPATYLWGYKTPSHLSDPLDVFSNLGAICLHFLVQIGGPYFRAVDSRPDFYLAAIFGAIGVALFVGGLVLAAFQPAKPQEKTLATLAIYLLGATLLVALGRVRFGVDQALSSRYATPVLAFWLSTLLIWFSATASRPRLQLLTLLVGAPMAVLPAVTEPRFVKVGLDWVLERNLAIPALLAGVNDPSLTNLLPQTDEVLESRTALISSRTSVFVKGWTRLIGANFAEQFTVHADDRCAGSFRRAQPVDEAGSGWSAVGTAWRKGSFDPLRRIVLVSGDGRIVGYGLGGFDSSSIGEEPDPETSNQPVWWTGDFMQRDPSKVTAYALDDKGSGCMIGSNPRIAPPAIAAAPLPSPAPERAGHIDSVTFDDNGMTIVGWGYLSSREGEVMIDTDLPVRAMTIKREPRPDVVSAEHHASLRNAGIEVRLTLDRNAGKPDPARLCVWTDDQKFGRRTLHDPVWTGAPPLFACDAAASRPANPAD
jgi:MFS family permease